MDRPLTLEERLTEDRRLVVLRVLNECPGCSANESILHDVLKDWGHRISRDQVKHLVAWLGEQHLVTVETVRGYMMATITQRGVDVVEANITVPGVKRPSPGR